VSDAGRSNGPGRNVESREFFRPGGAAGPSSEAEYEAKLASLAATIDQLKPDVLGVQEVGSPEAMADLVAKLGGDWHTELADPDRRGIRVGLVSRLPLSAVQQQRQDADDAGRLPCVQRRTSLPRHARQDIAAAASPDPKRRRLAASVRSRAAERRGQCVLARSPS
jgi:Endonuclease/Exonuclease/phosphatase family